VEFNPAEFLAATNEERAAKCREFAAEAERLGRAANDEGRDGYVDLARRWSELADEIEAAGSGINSSGDE
jgi:hypothetical protein